MRRRDVLAGIGTGAILGTTGCFGVLTEDAQPGGHLPEEVLSVAHLDGRYHFTDEPFLLEGTDVIADLGTNVCKIWLDFPT